MCIWWYREAAYLGWVSEKRVRVGWRVRSRHPTRIARDQEINYRYETAEQAHAYCQDVKPVNALTTAVIALIFCVTTSQ